MSSGSARELSEIRVGKNGEQSGHTSVREHVAETSGRSPRHELQILHALVGILRAAVAAQRQAPLDAHDVNGINLNTEEPDTLTRRGGIEQSAVRVGRITSKLYHPVSWVVTRLLDQLPADLCGSPRSRNPRSIQDRSPLERAMLPDHTDEQLAWASSKATRRLRLRRAHASSNRHARLVSGRTRGLRSGCSSGACRRGASLPVNLERPTPAVLAFVWDHLDRGRRHQGETQPQPGDPLARITAIGDAGGFALLPTEDLPEVSFVECVRGASSRSTCAAMRRRGSPCRTRSSNSEASTDCRRCGGSKLWTGTSIHIWRSRRSTVTALSNMKCSRKYSTKVSW